MVWLVVMSVQQEAVSEAADKTEAIKATPCDYQHVCIMADEHKYWRDALKMIKQYGEEHGLGKTNEKTDDKTYWRSVIKMFKERNDEKQDRAYWREALQVTKDFLYQRTVRSNTTEKQRMERVVRKLNKFTRQYRRPNQKRSDSAFWNKLWQVTRGIDRN